MLYCDYTSMIFSQRYFIKIFMSKIRYI